MNLTRMVFSLLIFSIQTERITSCPSISLFVRWRSCESYGKEQSAGEAIS